MASGCVSFDAGAAASGAGGSGSASLGGPEGAGVSTCDVSSGGAAVQPNHPPSHPDDVVGRSEVSAADGASGIGVSVVVPAPSVCPPASTVSGCFEPVVSPGAVWVLLESVDGGAASAAIGSFKLLVALMEAELARLRLELFPVLFKSYRWRSGVEPALSGLLFTTVSFCMERDAVDFRDSVPWVPYQLLVF